MQAIHYLGNFKNLHTQIQQDYRIMIVILIQKFTYTNTARLQNYDYNVGTKTYIHKYNKMTEL